jgi:hypothetical protein
VLPILGQSILTARLEGEGHGRIASSISQPLFGGRELLLAVLLMAFMLSSKP